MKKITKQEVKHIAYLARLALSEEELELYSQQLEVILEYMDKLQEVDTTQISPLTNIIKMYKNLNIKPNYRDDIPEDSRCQQELLNNAPQLVGNFFKVEKVIE
ncbi:MAG: Asp-tRNA(Asn)/Glu-tRNA(Gln) amidotransferase subunit GatC [Endomicrobia bacterium]|nr:Asp-tRNA(Asn)/Glu-tRNA(Gln) amidotransferase subunit GatC [Endomicrobiia bacterium]MCX7716465.1 Asp-tRNA(Asn)/Glu-tRNA(Gln) amidotransferase subunit GatC [Endomicrobiia bacterium]